MDRMRRRYARSPMFASTRPSRSHDDCGGFGVSLPLGNRHPAGRIRAAGRRQGGAEMVNN